MSDYIRKYQSAETSHTHDDHHQIILPITGNLELEVEGLHGDVAGRMLGIIPSGQTHAFRANGANNFLVLDIADLQGDHNLENVWARAIDTPFQTMSEALISLSDYAAFCSQQNRNRDWFETWQKLFLTTLECDLTNDLPALPQRIEKAITFMQTNMGRSLTNKELAEASCLSPARFYELFRQATGISPQAYLTQSRLKMAKRLILNGHSLIDAASEVGFSDQSSFGRAFQKEFSISPGKWRKQESGTKKPER